jgi:hypothetical protein
VIDPRTTGDREHQPELALGGGARARVHLVEELAAPHLPASGLAGVVVDDHPGGRRRRGAGIARRRLRRWSHLAQQPQHRGVFRRCAAAGAAARL